MDGAAITSKFHSVDGVVITSKLHSVDGVAITSKLDSVDDVSSLKSFCLLLGMVPIWRFYFLSGILHSLISSHTAFAQMM